MTDDATMHMSGLARRGRASRGPRRQFFTLLSYIKYPLIVQAPYMVHI